MVDAKLDALCARVRERVPTVTSVRTPSDHDLVLLLAEMNRVRGELQESERKRKRDMKQWEKETNADIAIITGLRAKLEKAAGNLGEAHGECEVLKEAAKKLLGEWHDEQGDPLPAEVRSSIRDAFPNIV